ncbi:MAG TPA: glycosyltransferase family 4 protein [Gammaproteobacteria bacterium]|nr:glycosyltransferase family 4 protein [Gammaproteobacteria bacterium]
MSFDNHTLDIVFGEPMQVAIAVFILALAGTAWFSSRFMPFRVLDAPNERSLHVGQIPRTGGVAIVVALIIGISYLLIRNSLQLPLAIGCGTVLLVSIISFLDDVYKLAPLFRLSVQVLAAATAISAGINVSLIHLPGIVYPLPYMFAVVFTLLFIIWMTNLYNFMDGMDGFAGGMAVLGFSVLGCLGLRADAIGYAGVCFAVAAASAGFLIFNFPPARIFMGDVGSSTLGYLVGVLGIWADREHIAPLWATVLIFSPFIVDATITLVRRLLAGEKVWQAHRSHYYQRLVQAGWGHRRVVLCEYLVMLAAAGSTVLAVQYSKELVQWIVLLVWIAIYLALAWSVDRIWQASLVK